MLVITRVDGQVVLVGNDIRIVVLRSEQGKVRFGIDAPQDVVIKRAELPTPTYFCQSCPYRTADAVKALTHQDDMGHHVTGLGDDTRSTPTTAIG